MYIKYATKLNNNFLRDSSDKDNTIVEKYENTSIGYNENNFFRPLVLATWQLLNYPNPISRNQLGKSHGFLHKQHQILRSRNTKNHSEF
jgi:hypothetical protein